MYIENFIWVIDSEGGVLFVLLHRRISARKLGGRPQTMAHRGGFMTKIEDDCPTFKDVDERAAAVFITYTKEKGPKRYNRRLSKCKVDYF